MNKIVAFTVGMCMLGFCVNAADKPKETVSKDQFTQAVERISYINTREREILQEIARLEIDRSQKAQIISTYQKEQKEIEKAAKKAEKKGEKE